MIVTPESACPLSVSVVPAFWMKFVSTSGAEITTGELITNTPIELEEPVLGAVDLRTDDCKELAGALADTLADALDDELSDALGRGLDEFAVELNGELDEGLGDEVGFGFEVISEDGEASGVGDGEASGVGERKGVGVGVEQT
jgi:hypothetical protein